MAEAPDIKVLVEDFRAVANADIIIDGITVVAGENGSGKSSMSKLLYYLYKTVAEYEKIVKQSLYYSFSDIVQALDIIFQETSHFNSNTENKDLDRELFMFRIGLMRLKGFEIEEQELTALVTTAEYVFYHILENKPEALKLSRVERFRRILQDILGVNAGQTLHESFTKVKDLIKKRFETAKETINLRPTSLFISELRQGFSDGELPKRFEVQEYGDPIFASDKDHLSIPYNIQKAVYIDSPMMFHSTDSKNIHWQDLIKLLNERGDNTHHIADLINKEIIKGEVITEEGPYATAEVNFKRNDGKVFNLLDVATGVKSFSMLQLLLKNGSITDKTLMIIDEPESNLHPQWIIEYARIIVMLNKEIGAKFFIATHNPDMVSAIRYISEKEGTLNKVNFYLAEKSEEEFKYNYTYLNKEIDPIFASFNIALDRINQYGA